MSMADRDGFIWLDGEMVPWRDAKIHVLTHTLHYGMGVFEGVRAYETHDGRTAVFRLKDHTRRLLNSAKIFQMKVPFDHDQLVEAQLDVLRQNQLKSGYIRPLVWIGSEKMGVSARDNQIHVSIAAWPWGAYLGEDGINKGIRVKTSSFTHHMPNISMCKAKAVSNYPVSIMANREVTQNGYDEAMLMDPHGFVCQGSGENVYLVKNGEVHTPDLSGGALDGITRQVMQRFCADLGIKFVERRITRDEFYICDEAFFTGTAAEVTPIREYDDRMIGDGKRGPVTEKLQTLFFDVVQGKNDNYSEWLSYLD